ncbi:hypothetical protein AOLI_G00206780 [Acnodon oligacanthus]
MSVFGAVFVDCVSSGWLLHKSTDLLERLRSRISDTLGRPQLDLDYFQYLVNQEVFILTSASAVFDVPSEIVDGLLALQRKINGALSQEAPSYHMREHGLSTRSTYSSLSDHDLDNAVRSIKRRIPSAGYRMVKGFLQADGHRGSALPCLACLTAPAEPKLLVSIDTRF